MMSDIASTIAENGESNIFDKLPKNLPLSCNKQKILDEESYTLMLEKIIQRDFFPDLPKLKAQTEYLEAVENNDLSKLRAVQAKYHPRTGDGLNSTCGTPSTFETPLTDRITITPRGESSQTDLPENEDQGISGLKKDERGKLSVDDFLSKYTSEDNASFEIIMEEAAKQHKLKYPWLHKDEEDIKKKILETLSLKLTSGEQTGSNRNLSLTTWAYKNKNALMYVPEGAELTSQEKIDFARQTKVEYQNTHYHTPPFNEQASQAAIAEAASVQAKMKEGKVGIDGKEILPQDSPQVNGYGFVSTPSIVPGVEDTPMMTWGEIEGTPFRLDGSDTPLPQNAGGPQFKIPELPARERIALSLADKAAKQHRTKKQEALKRVQSSFSSPSVSFGCNSPKTPLERLNSMSPAAQLLACSKLGIQRDTDRALRASYSPSPYHTPQGDRTPLLCMTPNSTSSGSSRRLTVDTSVTDKLLHKSKRKKTLK